MRIELNFWEKVGAVIGFIFTYIIFAVYIITFFFHPIVPK